MGFFSRSHNASPASSVGAVESAVSSGRAMRDMEEGVGAIQEEEDREVQAEGESPVVGEAETWDSCCLICFERLGPRDCMDPPKSDEGQPCDHVFCRTCCRAYLETRIASGVTFHPCPMFGPEGCTGFWRYAIHKLGGGQWKVWVVRSVVNKPRVLKVRPPDKACM